MVCCFTENAYLLFPECFAKTGFVLAGKQFSLRQFFNICPVRFVVLFCKGQLLKSIAVLQWTWWWLAWRGFANWKKGKRCALKWIVADMKMWMLFSLASWGVWFGLMYFAVISTKSGSHRYLRSALLPEHSAPRPLFLFVKYLQVWLLK